MARQLGVNTIREGLGLDVLAVEMFFNAGCLKIINLSTMFENIWLDWNRNEAFRYYKRLQNVRKIRFCHISVSVIGAFQTDNKLHNMYTF